MALFIVKSYGLDRQGANCLKWLRRGVALLGGQIDRVPWFLDWVTIPYRDYQNSAATYIKIMDELLKTQRPPGCELYWGKED